MSYIKQDELMFFGDNKKIFPVYEAFVSELISRFPKTKIKVQKNPDFFFKPPYFCVRFIYARQKKGGAFG